MGLTLLLGDGITHHGQFDECFRVLDGSDQLLDTANFAMVCPALAAK